MAKTNRANDDKKSEWQQIIRSFSFRPFWFTLLMQYRWDNRIELIFVIYDLCLWMCFSVIYTNVKVKEHIWNECEKKVKIIYNMYVPIYML